VHTEPNLSLAVAKPYIVQDSGWISLNPGKSPLRCAGSSQERKETMVGSYRHGGEMLLTTPQAPMYVAEKNAQRRSGVRLAFAAR
jgi:hypothetical protein